MVLGSIQNTVKDNAVGSSFQQSHFGTCLGFSVLQLPCTFLRFREHWKVLTAHSSEQADLSPQTQHLLFCDEKATIKGLS